MIRNLWKDLFQALLHSPTALTTETRLVMAAAREVAGLTCAPDTGGKMVVRQLMASPQLSPLYTCTR